eukprot:13187987-Alexandrium_andersonii.AAC.1
MAELGLLGGHLRVAGDTEDAPTTISCRAGKDMTMATGRFQNIYEASEEFRRAGLSDPWAEPSSS